MLPSLLAVFLPQLVYLRQKLFQNVLFLYFSEKPALSEDNGTAVTACNADISLGSLSGAVDSAAHNCNGDILGDILYGSFYALGKPYNIYPCASAGGT